MSKEEFEIVKIVLEKGLLALLVAGFVFFFSRSVEKLKASLSWGAELLKQRMSAAKQLLQDVRELQHHHLQILGGQLIEGTMDKSAIGALQDDFRKVEISKTELSMLQAGASAINALDEVLVIASRVIGAQPPGTAGSLSFDQEGRPRLQAASPDRNAWMEQEQLVLGDSVSRFHAELAKSFPTAGF